MFTREETDSMPLRRGSLIYDYYYQRRGVISEITVDGFIYHDLTLHRGRNNIIKNCVISNKNEVKLLVY